MSVRDGRLFMGEHDLTALAGQYGTPVYVTDEQRIKDNFYRLNNALSRHYEQVQVLYAAKANGNLSVLRALAECGCGADVFSSGELRLALEAGMPPEKLLFNGNSKSREDLSLAVSTGVRVSVDSFDELRQLNEVAEGKKVKIAFRINPAIEVPTHPKIATGLKTTKFGIPAEEIIDAYREALSCPNIEPVGIHCHIGSQILEVAPFVRAAEVMAGVAEEVTSIGVNLEFVDIGGGLGIPYDRSDDHAPSMDEYADAVMPVFLDSIKRANIKPALWVEPGRSLVGDSSVLVVKVNSIKQAYKNFVNVDAGFNLLARPVMYDSYHDIVVANKADLPPVKEYTIAGPICETGDLLASDRMLPEISDGDYIAILDTGAYGFAMSSQYNGRPRCAEILINGKKQGPMRRKESIDDIMATMKKPSWH